MIENLPFHIPILFILTTFLTIGFLFYSVRQIGIASVPSKIIVAIISFWLFFTASASLGGFYTDSAAMPPRVFLFGAFPALVTIIQYFLFFRSNFIELVPLRVMTMLSIVRIPVEIVIYLLYQNGAMPQVMTFEGRNFDILSGFAAPLIFWLAFRGNKINRPLLIFWNVAGLILLANIVTIAVLAVPSPFQQIAFEQPNSAVMYFPFIWLPAIVVPIVLFSHLASLWQLMRAKPKT